MMLLRHHSSLCMWYTATPRLSVLMLCQALSRSARVDSGTCVAMVGGKETKASLMHDTDSDARVHMFGNNDVFLCGGAHLIQPCS